MPNPANGVPPVETAQESGENRVLRVAPAWAVLWLVAASVVVAWWRLAPMLDEALVATIFIAGAAWWLINAGCRRAQSPGVGVVGLGLVGSLLALRLLQVASPIDFWILRTAPLLLLPATALIIGGTSTLKPALPGGAALLLWLWWPNMGWLMELDAGGGVSRFTARATGLILDAIGHSTKVEGNSIWLNNIRVDVLVPCTCIPLVLALVKTLLPAALLVRLTWRRTAVLALLVGPVAFVVSVVRCAVLVLVAPSAGRFHYWHGPEGAGLFTAVALAIIGWVVVAGARAPVWLSTPVPPVSTRVAGRCALSLVAGASVVAWWGQPAVAARSLPLVWNPPPGWRIVAHRPFTWPAEATGTDKPLAQCEEWLVDSPGGRTRFLVGYAPVLLGGDAAQLAYLEGFDSRPAADVQGVVLPGLDQPVATWASASDRWFVTFAGGDGVARATPAAWIQWLHGQRWEIVQWGRLLSGRGALLDKRALWVAVVWPDVISRRPEVQAATTRLLTSGLDMAAALLSAAGQANQPDP